MVSALYNACSFVTLSNILRDLIPANHYTVTERQYMNVVYIGYISYILTTEELLYIVLKNEE
jgi:hypothetical protein